MNINNSWLSVSAVNTKSSNANTGFNINGKGEHFKSILAKGAANANKNNEGSSATSRVDKVNFSHSVAKQSQPFELSKLKEKLVSEMNADTNSQKVQALAQQFSDKQYKINPNELATLILSE